MIEGAKSRNNNDLRNNDVGVSFDYYESPSDEVTFAAAASNDQGGRPVEEMLMDRFGQKTESIDADDFLPINRPTKKNVVQALYICIFAIFGCLLRVVLAQGFGAKCDSPSYNGWLASGSPLCIDDSGTVTQLGGIVYADLASNMLGSFIMGLFTPCSSLNLAGIDVNIPWLPAKSSFQSATILHNAFTIGFCGSLTTLSSWNSAMVVLLFGTGSSQTQHNIIHAILGYIIGMQAVLGSYFAAHSLSRALYSSVNHILAQETDATKERKMEGVFLDTALPDFERRYLADLNMGDESGEKNYGEVLPVGGALDSLNRWRESTKAARRVHHPLLQSLVTIEHAFLVEYQPLPKEAESIAMSQGWDLPALRDWARAKCMDHGRLPSLSSSSGLSAVLMELQASMFFTVPYAVTILAILMTICGFFTISLIAEDDFSTVTRTIAYSMLWAPPGVLLRWFLGTFNGVAKHQSWFPFGTFSANVIGSVISIVGIALEYSAADEMNTFWTIGTLRALRVGFCVSSVSTFVAETAHFMIRNTGHAYPYMAISLISCGAMASSVYAISVY